MLQHVGKGKPDISFICPIQKHQKLKLLFPVPILKAPVPVVIGAGSDQVRRIAVNHILGAQALQVKQGKILVYESHRAVLQLFHKGDQVAPHLLGKLTPVSSKGIVIFQPVIEPELIIKRKTSQRIKINRISCSVIVIPKLQKALFVHLGELKLFDIPVNSPKNFFQLHGLKRLEQLNKFGIDIVADNPVRRDVDSHVGTAGKQVHKGRNLLGKLGQDLRQQLILSTDVIQGALQVFFGGHRLIAQGIGPDLIHLGMAHLFTDVKNIFL